MPSLPSETIRFWLEKAHPPMKTYKLVRKGILTFQAGVKE
jgi:hypothetical protein